jgi:hypothetical protein
MDESKKSGDRDWQLEGLIHKRYDRQQRGDSRGQR